MTFGLREHLETVLRHWGKVLLVMFGAFLVAFAMAFTTSKVYIAQARVLLLTDSPAERVTNIASGTPEFGASPKEQVLTQVQIAKSPLLATRLAEDLGPKYVLDQTRRKWDWARQLPGKLKDNTILFFANWEPTSELIRESGINIPTPGENADPPVYLARDKLMDALFIDAVPKTDMFVIAFSSPDPDFSADVVNAMLDIYVEHSVSLARQTEGAQIAEQAADRLEAELREAEARLHAFTNSKNILSIDKQKDLLLDRITRLQDETFDAERAALEADQRISAMMARLQTIADEQELQVTTRPNPVVDTLRSKMADLETELARYVPGSPAEARIRNEMQSVQAQLQNVALEVRGGGTSGASSVYLQLQNTLALEQAVNRAAAARADFTRRQLAATEEELRELNEFNQTSIQLQRTVDARERAYLFALQTREETAIMEQISQGGLSAVVPVERATAPEVAAAPKRAVLLVLGLILGGMAGIALAYVLEFRRHWMATSKEVEAALGVDVLGAMQRVGLIARWSNKNALAIRALAARLGARPNWGDQSSYLIVAPQPTRDGPRVTESLADALQKLGRRVLYLDLAPTAKAKKSTVGEPSGEADPMSPDLAETNDVLALKIEAPAWEMERQVARHLDERKGQIDFILVKAPPLAAFPEQLMVAHRLDGALLLIEARRTDARAALKVIEQLKTAEVPIFGAILTNQHKRHASWAFSWMAATRRLASTRALADAKSPV